MARVLAAIVLLGGITGIGIRTAAAHGLVDQVWDACTNLGYAPDPCDCDTGDPDLCCMGQAFLPGASTLTGFDLLLSGGPDADPNASFSTYVTVDVRMRTVQGPLLGNVTAPLTLPSAFLRTWVHFDLPAPLVLAQGIAYVLEVRAAPAGVTWWGSSASTCGAEYAGGTALTSLDPGCCDFDFRTYGGFVAGGGGRQSDCAHEWLTEPPPPLDAGAPVNRLECTDGDPTCDFGPAGDGACTFHVAECLNVADPLLACTPYMVSTVKLRGPSRPVDVRNRRALADGLVAWGGLVSGRCRNAGAPRGLACALDPDCDSAPGRGDGVCDARQVAFVPPLAAGDACTDFADVTVTLGTSTTAARKVLRVAATRPGLPTDADSLTLVCRTAP